MVWFLLQILQIAVAVLRALWGGLSRVDWADVGAWVLAFAAVTGVGFLIYLPVENWVAEQRRRKALYQRLRRGAEVDAAADDPVAIEITLTDQDSVSAGREAVAGAGEDALSAASSEAAQDRAPHQITADAAAGVCPYCQTAVAAGTQIILCPACQTPHHVDCWRENRGCTVYGCRYEPKG